MEKHGTIGANSHDAIGLKANLPSLRVHCNCHCNSLVIGLKATQLQTCKTFVTFLISIVRFLKAQNIFFCIGIYIKSVKVLLTALFAKMSEIGYVKEHVDESNIHIECAPIITERAVATRTCHECVIENYSKLKEKVFYTMTGEVEILGRTLKLYKTKKTHNFQFHCELTKAHVKTKYASDLTGKVEFYIVYDQHHTIDPGDLVETNYGFSVDVPNEFIIDPINTYLKEEDKLVIQFRYKPFFYPRDPICRSGISRKKDAEILSKDMLALYESGKFADFSIEDKDGKKHHVHKWICRSRSATIDSIDDDNVVALTVEGKSRYVEIVIRYMYSGILPDLSVDDLLKVLVVAEALDIEFLLLSISNALQESLNASNAQKIYKATMNCEKMDRVANLAEELLPQETEKKRRNRR